MSCTVSFAVILSEFCENSTYVIRLRIKHILEESLSCLDYLPRYRDEESGGRIMRRDVKRIQHLQRRQGPTRRRRARARARLYPIPDIREVTCVVVFGRNMRAQSSHCQKGRSSATSRARPEWVMTIGPFRNEG